MPSSHSSFVMALTMSIGFTQGFDSGAFAISAVMSFVVMYDAQVSEEVQVSRLLYLINWLSLL
mgnify:CR=1 FL=1